MYPEPQLDELYREIILDHYRNPRNRGQLADPDVASEGDNPLCGDEILLTLHIRDGHITAVRFAGQGCSISQASASMMTQQMLGKSLAEAEALTESFKAMVLGKRSSEDDDLGDLEALEGVAKFPVRVKCATMAWHTLQQGIKQYRSQKG